MKKPLAILLLALVPVLPALADPPAHAPAHGYRNKAAKMHRGYTGVEWERDYGVSSGRCNTDEVLTVLGGAAGAVIGNRAAEPENRTVATIAGAVIGAVLGNVIGDQIDSTDRACVGHSLEVGATGKAITWTNPRTRATHVLTPVRDLAGNCRLFSYRIGKAQAVSLRGCRDARGSWAIQRG